MEASPGPLGCGRLPHPFRASPPAIPELCSSLRGGQRWGKGCSGGKRDSAAKAGCRAGGGGQEGRPGRTKPGWARDFRGRRAGGRAGSVAEAGRSPAAAQTCLLQHSFPQPLLIPSSACAGSGEAARSQELSRFGWHARPGGEEKPPPHHPPPLSGQPTPVWDGSRAAPGQEDLGGESFLPCSPPPFFGIPCSPSLLAFRKGVKAWFCWLALGPGRGGALGGRGWLLVGFEGRCHPILILPFIPYLCT